ncbi:hypothetical protein AB0L63_07160 [Nocardia sp. NPDC051990]|uniref:hypothetical protein n=1 Tax=Nocardia sp. NPDC051990 TaxID=3155285 RepID=UPI003441982D
MSEHQTEMDGWQAIWRLDDQRIRIMLVSNIFESTTVMSTTDSATAPDLVQMRERFPKLDRLWDAIRHAYWSELRVPQEHSQGTI